MLEKIFLHPTSINVCFLYKEEYRLEIVFKAKPGLVNPTTPLKNLPMNLDSTSKQCALMRTVRMSNLQNLKIFQNMQIKA